MPSEPVSSNPGSSDQETHLTQSGEPDKRFKEHGGGQHGRQGESFAFDKGDGSSSLVTEGTGEDTGTHKPSAHDGKKEDGTDDKRTSSEHGFGGDRERASEAGKKGGSASYDNGGLTK
ncbi:hypothetical protein QFC22_005037 [Naganishia vaughanmartiniae]|uniref:Uncharacterized protein n=1 Tax=Naganishia vaughanmartiniae TaxID=1424756 RepID=A0ACC2WXK9_9TREE|nr:hypothetical protein QFC22_005037 [Naganishia vaughanmartiniae]